MLLILGSNKSKPVKIILQRLCEAVGPTNIYSSHDEREQVLKPGVHTNDFVPIYGRRANKLGHASLTTVFRHSRLTFQPILQENLESPLLRYQPITTAVVTEVCLNTRWHHGIYIICLERVARYGSGRDNVRGSVGAMNAELSRPDLLATVQLVRKQA